MVMVITNAALYDKKSKLSLPGSHTVYPKKYAHGFVVLCFVVVMQSFIMNSHEVFIHIHQGCFAGTEAIVRLPQCQRSKPDGYGKISQCITTTKHSKAKTVCIFLGIYCMSLCLRYTWCIYACQQICWSNCLLHILIPQRDQVQLSSYTTTGITYKYSGPSESQHIVAWHGVTESDRN